MNTDYDKPIKEESSKGKEAKADFLDDIHTLELITKENPCKLSNVMFRAFDTMLKEFIMKHCLNTASRTQVAEYLGKDVRTLSRYKEKYDDFPVARRSGHREITYSWYDVIRWKLKHKEEL